MLEKAAASGLGLVPFTHRNPLTPTSYGTGELIRHALAAFYEVVEATLQVTVRDTPGAGAAGGIAYLHSCTAKRHTR